MCALASHAIADPDDPVVYTSGKRRDNVPVLRQVVEACLAPCT